MRADFGAVPLRASLSLLLEVVLVPEQLRHEAVVRPGGIPLRFHQRGRLGGGQPSRLHEVRQDEDDGSREGSIAVHLVGVKARDGVGLGGLGR